MVYGSHRGQYESVFCYCDCLLHWWHLNGQHFQLCHTEEPCLRRTPSARPPLSLSLTPSFYSRENRGRTSLMLWNHCCTMFLYANTMMQSLPRCRFQNQPVVHFLMLLLWPFPSFRNLWFVKWDPRRNMAACQKVPRTPKSCIATP